jgi:predicted nuclease with TOPRIM domain
MQEIKQSREVGSNQAELIEQVMELEQENIRLKTDYSKALQEINSLLMRYQNLEENLDKIMAQKAKSADAADLQARIVQLEQECERLRIILTDQEQ